MERIPPISLNTLPRVVEKCLRQRLTFNDRFLLIRVNPFIFNPFDRAFLLLI